MVFERYNKIATGFVAGLVLPWIVALLIFLFAKGEPNLKAWLLRLEMADIYTNMITICVVPNAIIFALFNYLDMLLASRGMLYITMIWTVFLFAVKIFT